MSMAWCMWAVCLVFIIFLFILPKYRCSYVLGGGFMFLSIICTKCTMTIKFYSILLFYSPILFWKSLPIKSSQDMSFFTYMGKICINIASEGFTVCTVYDILWSFQKKKKTKKLKITSRRALQRRAPSPIPWWVDTQIETTKYLMQIDYMK